jgi:hypothetical protein
LFNQLLRSHKGRCELTANRITILTFNFDRSFERALYLLVRANCGGNAIAQLQQIPVYHLHGQLGLPAWLQTSVGGLRAYNPNDTTSQVVRMCAQQIRIVDDEVTDSQTLGLALLAIDDADVVAFLGFSYHPLNLRKIPLERLNGKEVRGTAYKLPAGPRSAVERTFAAAGAKILLAGPDDHVLTFLENTDLIHD